MLIKKSPLKGKVARLTIRKKLMGLEGGPPPGKYNAHSRICLYRGKQYSPNH